MANSNYTATGVYNDKGLSAADMAKVNAYKQQWEAASAAGDRAGMDMAHAGAEAVRAQYSYSGGGDGSEYHGFAQGTQPQYSRAEIDSARSADAYINGMYAAAQEASLNALKSAYDQNVLTLDSARAAIPQGYDEARNYTAAQSETQRAGFNELAAGRGLNSGAGSQALLSIGNVLQNNLSGIARAEAGALSDIDLQRAKLETAYKNDVAQAVASGNLAKAQTLYEDFVRVDNSLTSASRAQADEDYRAWSARNSTYESNRDALERQAKLLSAFGDFSGYLKLGYTPDMVARMQAAFAAE